MFIIFFNFIVDGERDQSSIIGNGKELDTAAHGNSIGMSHPLNTACRFFPSTLDSTNSLKRLR